MNIERQLKKLEKEDEQIIKQFDKLDHRTNTFLSISLGVFSLQMTLLTGNIITIYENFLKETSHILLVIISVFFILDILFNLNSIVNFRRSTKTSEELISNKEFKDHISEYTDENTILKEELIKYEKNKQKNKKKIKYKKRYINFGLNNIIICLSLIVIITSIIFLRRGV